MRVVEILCTKYRVCHMTIYNHVERSIHETVLPPLSPLPSCVRELSLRKPMSGSLRASTETATETVNAIHLGPRTFQSTPLPSHLMSAILETRYVCMSNQKTAPFFLEHRRFIANGGSGGLLNICYLA